MELIKDGATVDRQSVTDNVQRLVRVKLNAVECDTVKVNILDTWGDTFARVFEIRAY